MKRIQPWNSTRRNTRSVVFLENGTYFLLSGGDGKRYGRFFVNDAKRYRLLQNNADMNFLEKIKERLAGKARPEHLRRGDLGERAAEKFLKGLGLKFLARNFRSARGEIDLVFREADCLVFVEVKTRSPDDWSRPADKVDARKKKLLSQTALDYLKLLKNPEVKFRFDIVEVLLLDGEVREVRHLPNSFPLSRPYRYA